MSDADETVTRKVTSSHPNASVIDCAYLKPTAGSLKILQLVSILPIYVYCFDKETNGNLSIADSWWLCYPHYYKKRFHVLSDNPKGKIFP